MADIRQDLGWRILQAARLAVAVHLKQVAAERSGIGFPNGHMGMIGGAGPSACPRGRAEFPEASRDGCLPDLCARWTEGEAE